MSNAQQYGSDYDNDVAVELHRRTPSDVCVLPTRGSGNVAIAQPDVLVRTDVIDYAIELKRSTVDTGEYFYVEEEDLVQLHECGNKYTHCVFGMKFTRRELLVTFLPSVEGETPAEALASVTPSAFDPHVTDSGSIRYEKPDTDVWPSSRAGKSDVEVVADELDLALSEPTDDTQRTRA